MSMQMGGAGGLAAAAALGVAVVLAGVFSLFGEASPPRDDEGSEKNDKNEKNGKHEKNEKKKKKAFTDKTVKWGIIGVGDVCEVKAGPGFQKAVGSELVAVQRRTAHLAEDFAKRHGVSKWYSDHHELLADDDVNAVYNASPPGAHLEHALAAAAAGKVTLLEKPMARNTHEAEMIVRAFEEAGVPLYVAYYRRSHPTWKEMKRVLDVGEIGKVTSIAYQCLWPQPKEATLPPGSPIPWRLTPKNSGGGLVLDVGTHAVDMLAYLFGSLSVVGGDASNVASPALAVEDRVEMVFKTEKGVLGNASWDFTLPPDAEWRDNLVIRGTQGSIEASVLRSDRFMVKTITNSGEVNEVEVVAPYGPHAHAPLIQSIVDELLKATREEGRVVCQSTGETGLVATRLLDQVLARFYGGRDGEFWLRP